MMNKIIVTTTINPPTEALQLFSKMPDWDLVVVGDKKTPGNLYSKINCIYLTPEEQEADYFELSKQIGWNTIERRNFGFLRALEMGGEIIASVDDDNVPLSNWGENLIVGTKATLTSYQANQVFDPISVTNYPHLWHRGFPIQRLQSRETVKSSETLFVDIEASFWNGDPDIDAICRMEHAPNCNFDAKHFPFTSQQPSPFNSQNTFFSRSALKSYFMFPFVGRMDDIWASYYLQALGHRVAYTEASVRQDRNEHDLTIDFDREIIGYLNTESLIGELQSDPAQIRKYVGDASYAAFTTYLELAHKIA